MKGKKIHFIGVLGSSMSALAVWCDSLGAEVSGSDNHFDGAKAQKIKTRGYFYSGSRDEFVKNADIIVHSSAVSTEEPELAYAISLRKKIYERGAFLEVLGESCGTLIGVSGAHGKTTTTAMLAEIFLKSKKQVTIHIGGESRYFGSNFISEGCEYCITEACEYRRGFLSLHPKIAVVLNIDYDHPDYYKDLRDVENAFIDFCSNVKEGGVAIVPYGSILNGARGTYECRKVTFGTETGSDVRAENITRGEDGYRYNLNYFGDDLGIITLKSHLACNVVNSLAAVAVSLICGIDMGEINVALSTFCGTARRNETMGKCHGAEVVTDYAHHPIEIKQIISETKKGVGGKLYVIFEPHTYSRTAALLADFAVCFAAADEIIILPTFAARECCSENGNETTLFNHIVNENKRRISSYADAAEYINGTVGETDKVLLLGAGSIDILAKSLVEEHLS